MSWSIPCQAVADVNKLQLPPVGVASVSEARRIIRARERLGRLTDWDGPAPDEAFMLSSAIDVVMDKLVHDKSERLLWPIPVRINACRPEERGPESHLTQLPEIFISHCRDKTEGDTWKANEFEIEALLSLWLFSFAQKRSSKRSKYKRHRGEVSEKQETVKLLGPCSADSLRDFKWWLQETNTRFFEVYCAQTTDDHKATLHVESVLGYGGKSNEPFMYPQYRRA